ncbi:butyrophilin subfamily 1 member A1-like isoform 2-T2 [Polymixia lowei]
MSAKPNFLRLVVLLSMPAALHGALHEPGSKQNPRLVLAKEGDNVILPCYLQPPQNITDGVFDWKKGETEVFLYAKGQHYSNGRSGQDAQYVGRVSHFPPELKTGNASLTLTDAKVEDSGLYSCVFPRLVPSQRFFVNLTVGAAPQPRAKLVITKNGVLLTCVSKGAHPRPTVEFQDVNGNVVPAAVLQNSTDGGRYTTTVNATVTTSGLYRCVVKQESIGHSIVDEIDVPDKLFMTENWIVGLVTMIIGIVIGAAGVWCFFKMRSMKEKQMSPTPESSAKASLTSTESIPMIKAGGKEPC